MTKTAIVFIFVSVFLLISLVPGVGILLAGPSKAGANEIQSKPPALLTADGQLNREVLSDISNYVSDHFYLRQDMITLHNQIITKLFAVSPADDVILGSDDWLYYAQTLDDYTGAAMMTTRELYSSAVNLRLMQEYCRTRGMKFLFTIAPNKNSIYADNMPNFGAVADIHDAQRLLRLLEENGVSSVDLFEIFSGQDEVLYFTHDSHWNARGAALAADTINAAFGLNSSYYSGDFLQIETHNGDLFEMLYPTLADRETHYVYGGGHDFSYGAGGTQPDSITINTVGSGQENLLAFRDSFGNLLFPYLADSFASALFSRSVSYDLTQAAALDIQCVLIELVERNLFYLIQHVPVMPAPMRETPDYQETLGQADVIREQSGKAPEGYVFMRGTLLESVDDDSFVYLLCSDVCYEAFLLEDGSYAAYIPERAVPESVVFSYEGVLLSQDIIN